MKAIYALFLGLMITVFVGCAMPGSIVPNTTTADELTKKLGRPSDKRANPQGGETWDYVYGPEGYTTWRYAVDNGGMVRSAEQLLTLERLYKVAPGTTEAGVLELLGKPRLITRYRHEVVWEWRVYLSPMKGLYIVRFDFDGRARSAGVMEDMPADDSDRN
jgi:outer membrane protein assembly factor BamE (lipoprotein component of BamABCDE complex)